MPPIKNSLLLNYSLVKCVHMTFYKPASSLNSLDIFSLFFFLIQFCIQSNKCQE